MSARPTWKGFLKISLVTIPVKVYPATESSDGLAFHQLHRECQTRMQQRKWCPTCAREVTQSELVKGFECEPGKFVILSGDDFDTVRPPSTRVIDLVQFAPAAALDPTHIDRTYYLAPEGLGGEAFAVMRNAMKGTIGIGKLAIYGREYLVAVRPRAQALLLHTLHHAAEIRPIEAIQDPDAPRVVVTVAQLRLARQVIAACTRPLDLADFHDEYKEGLQALIDKKILGEEIVVPAIETPPVQNLHDALTHSLAAVRATKKAPLKVKPSVAKRRRA